MNVPYVATVPTEVCETFNKLYDLTDDQILKVRAEAFYCWGAKSDIINEVIALQVEYVCLKRGLIKWE